MQEVIAAITRGDEAGALQLIRQSNPEEMNFDQILIDSALNGYVEIFKLSLQQGVARKSLDEVISNTAFLFT